MNLKLRLENREFRGYVDESDASERLHEKLQAAKLNRQLKQKAKIQYAAKHNDGVDKVLNGINMEQMALKQKMDAKLKDAQVKREQYMCAKVRKCKRQAQLRETAVLKVQEKRSLLAKSNDEKLRNASVYRMKNTKKVQTQLKNHFSHVQRRKNNVTAAKNIQMWYRKRLQAKKWIERVFSKKNNIYDQMQEMILNIESANFENAMEILQNGKHIKMTKLFLSMVPKSNMIKKRAARFRNAKVFLMAPMIAYHKDEVLGDENEGDMEKLGNFLHKASLKLVNAVLDLNKNVNGKDQISHVLVNIEKLNMARVWYIDAFKAWKHIDGERFSGDLVAKYAEMYATNLMTKLEYGDKPKEDRIHEIMMRTDMQLKQLKHAIVKLLGVEATETRLAQLVHNLDIQVNAKFTQTQQNDLKRKEIQSDREEQLERRHQKAAKEPDLGFTKTVFSNDAIAHEIIMDPTFQLEQPPTQDEPASDLVKRMQTGMKKAFWDQMLTNIQNGSDDGKMMLLKQMEELRDMVTGVLGDSTKDHVELKAMLSTSAIEQAVGLPQGNISWVAVGQLVLALFNKILANEAPARNEATELQITNLSAAMRNSSNAEENAFLTMLPEVVEFVAKQVDYLRLDSVNAHLTMLAPYLQRHGVEHERSKFEEKFAADSSIIKGTNKWMKMSLEKYYASATAGERQLLHNGDALAFKRFFRFAFMELVEIHIQGQDPTSFPETFSMDIKRIREIRNNVDIMTLQASFVAIIQSSLKSHNIAFSTLEATEFCDNLKTLLEDPTVKLPDITAQVINEIKRKMYAIESPLSKEANVSLQTQIANVMSPENAIFKLYFGRIIKDITKRLSSSVDGSPVAPSKGIDMFVTDLEKSTVIASKVMNHNEAVYAKYYSAMVLEALPKSSQD